MNEQTTEGSVSELTSRIKDAAAVLDIKAEELAVKLKELGIDDTPETMDIIEDDDVFQFGDLAKKLDTPVVKIRLAFKVLKGNKPSKQRQGVTEDTLRLRRLGVKEDSIKNTDLETLLKEFKMGKPDDIVTRELIRRYGKKAYIVPDHNGRPDILETLGVITDMETGLDLPEGVRTKNGFMKLVVPGEKPDMIFDEDPMFPNNRLSTTQRSAVNHISYDGVSETNRQLIRLLVNKCVFDPSSKVAATLVVNQAKTDELKELYCEEATELAKLIKLGRAPALKIDLETLRGPKANNPFKKVY